MRLHRPSEPLVRYLDQEYFDELVAARAQRVAQREEP